MTTISERKRQFAFDLWKEAFQKHTLSIGEAGSPFRGRWGATPGDMSDELVLAADVLWGTSNSLTSKSAPVFSDKVRGLVMSRDEVDYQLRLSELEVTAFLARRVSPIAFEPAVPLSFNVSRQPPSSDYSLSLPCGEVFVEATSIDLRTPPTDTDGVLRRLKRKLNHKRHQAIDERIYIVALKVFGTLETFGAVTRVIPQRIWPNPQFKRFSGLLVFADVPGDVGLFQGAWLPNPQSVEPVPTVVESVFLGRRSFHLCPIATVDCRPEDIAKLRLRVETAGAMKDGFVVPTHLVGGPLDGIVMPLGPREVTHARITYPWYLSGTASVQGKPLAMPPNGPIEISYAHQRDTVYRFAGFRLWVDEYRPPNASDYIVRLSGAM